MRTTHLEGFLLLFLFCCLPFRAPFPLSFSAAAAVLSLVCGPRVPLPWGVGWVLLVEVALG